MPEKSVFCAAVLAVAVLVCAASPVQANFSLLPEGYRCEIQSQLPDDSSFSVSLKSAVPCGCDVRKAAVRIVHFRVVHFADMKCVAGGPGQITFTSKQQTRTVFVAVGEVALFRVDDKGHVTCRAARWRDPSELLANFKWPEAEPDTK
jgi:hypothetical protein